MAYFKFKIWYRLKSEDFNRYIEIVACDIDAAMSDIEQAFGECELVSRNVGDLVK